MSFRGVLGPKKVASLICTTEVKGVAPRWKRIRPRNNSFTGNEPKEPKEIYHAGETHWNQGDLNPKKPGTHGQVMSMLLLYVRDRPDKSPFWQMICPKNPCEILAKSILPRKKDIHPLRCDFSGESKDKPSDLGEKSPPRTPDPGASQRAFAAQDYGDLREHLAAVVIPSHFHGWEIFIPNGSKWYSRSLWQAFPTWWQLSDSCFPFWFLLVCFSVDSFSSEVPDLWSPAFLSSSKHSRQEASPE